MTAPPVPGDPSGEFSDVAPVTKQGNDQKSPRLLLSDADRTREAMLAARIAVEHARVVGPVDSRATGKYASEVVGRSRLFAGSDVRLHMRLLREHVAWLRGLPTWIGELRW